MSEHKAGRELDVFVAETFFNKKDDGIFITWVGKDSEKWAWWKEVTDEYGDGWKQEFKPSTDIAPAMMVEERIAELGLINRYCWELIKIADANSGEDESLRQTWGLIHATPLDRCLAALAAKEE